LPIGWHEGVACKNAFIQNAMMTLLLTLTGLFGFALFFFSVHQFEKI